MCSSAGAQDRDFERRRNAGKQAIDYLVPLKWTSVSYCEVSSAESCVHVVKIDEKSLTTIGVVVTWASEWLVDYLTISLFFCDSRARIARGV